MKIVLYEGEISADVLGAYESEFELLPSMMVAIPSRLLKNFGRAGFGKGTTFSRAVKSFKTSRASAPEVRFR